MIDPLFLRRGLIVMGLGYLSYLMGQPFGLVCIGLGGAVILRGVDPKPPTGV